MKYYLDVNAVVELYERDCTIENEMTYISSLTISEMCKNLDKNFDRQKPQFEFIENSKIRKDWKTYEEIIYGNTFGINYPRCDAKTQELYFTVLRSENFESFKDTFFQPFFKKADNNGKEFLERNSSLIKEMYLSIPLSLNMNNYNTQWDIMASNKNRFSREKNYKIKKKLLKSFLLQGFKINDIGELSGKRRSEFRKILKDYNGSIDLYLNCLIFYYKNTDKVERNDAPDLFHLSYLGKDDIFVSQDKKLRGLCDKVSNVTRVISVEEYLNRVNTNI